MDTIRLNNVATGRVANGDWHGGRGDLLWAAGAQGTWWRLDAGLVRLDRHTHPDRPQQGSALMLLALPGDWIGLESLEGEAYQFSATAMTPVRLSAGPARDSDSLLTMLAAACRRQRERQVDMVRLRTGPATQRLCHLLAMLAASQQADSTGRWNLPSTFEMADLIDTTRETVSKTVSALKRARVIDSRSRMLAGFDRERMLDAAMPQPQSRRSRASAGADAVDTEAARIG